MHDGWGRNALECRQRFTRRWSSIRLLNFGSRSRGGWVLKSRLLRTTLPRWNIIIIIPNKYKFSSVPLSIYSLSLWKLPSNLNTAEILTDVYKMIFKIRAQFSGFGETAKYSK